MSNISISGLGSGLDIQSIVSQLVAVERAPLTKLTSQQSTLQAKLSTFGTIKSQFSTLADTAAKLSGSSGWNAVTATSSNSDAIKVTASAGAPATSFTMEVDHLAKAQSAASTAVPVGSDIGSGTMTIEIGKWTGSTFAGNGDTPVEVTIDPDAMTLADIASAINDADAGVSATVLKDSSGERLLVRSKETGEENGFRISVADDDGQDTDASGLSSLAFDLGNANGMAQSQPPLDAHAIINGVDVYSASNRLTDTLPGMTIQLQQATTQPVEIDVSSDMETIKGNLEAFVSAYNAINTTIATATRYDAGTKVAGTLQGDSTAVGLQNALRSMMRSVSGSSPYTKLSEIGIAFQTDGTLSIDSSKLDDALNTDFQGVKDLFTIDTGDATTQGFGHKIEAFAQGLIDADGLISTRRDALQKAIDRNNDEQDKVNARADRAETRYLAQYTAMDVAVGKLNSLNSFVAQQITLWNNSSG